LRINHGVKRDYRAEYNSPLICSEVFDYSPVPAAISMSRYMQSRIHSAPICY